MNTKDEFLYHCVGKKKVLCAEINHVNDYAGEDVDVFLLPVGYGEEAWEKFLAMLDFEYDNSLGTQELYGTIWYTDGTWSERGEYDGSEKELERFAQMIEEMIALMSEFNIPFVPRVL